MALTAAAPYAPNYMQSWTDWFREQQEAIGTIDEFVRLSGIKQRMVGNYRAGAIPKRQESIDKIVAIIGEPGPLPPSRRAATATLTARVAALEKRVGELEARLLETLEPPHHVSAVSDGAAEVDPVVAEVARGLSGQRPSRQPAPRTPRPRRAAQREQDE